MARRSGQRLITLPSGKTVERTDDSLAELDKQLAEKAKREQTLDAKSKTGTGSTKSKTEKK